MPKPFITGWPSLSPALPSQPGLGRESGPDAGQSRVLCCGFSRPTEAAAAMLLDFRGSAQGCPVRACSSPLARGQGFVYCSQSRHSPSSRLGHFLKTLSSWLTVLASCFRLRCLAQLRPVKWPSQLLSSSVLPSQRAHSKAGSGPSGQRLFALCWFPPGSY